MKRLNNINERYERYENLEGAYRRGFKGRRVKTGKPNNINERYERYERELNIEVIPLSDITHFFTCLKPLFYNPQGGTEW